MVRKLKTIPFLERRDQADYKYILRNWFNSCPQAKKGCQSQNIGGTDLCMTFWWPLRVKLTFDQKTDFFIWFLDPKNPLKMVWFSILTFLVFLGQLNYIAYYFRPLGRKRPNAQLVAFRGDFYTLWPFKITLQSFLPRGGEVNLCWLLD